jgi:hypothetical protein
VERLDAFQVPWGTLVIDARWFIAGGLKNVDVGRWPDLRGFIDAQHRRGRRVLLWWGPWNPEGIAAEHCVRYRSAQHPHRLNRPGRLVKFGSYRDSTSLAIDVTLPPVRDMIRAQVRTALGRDGLDADGFKIDQVSAVPGIYGMTFSEGSGRLFGIEALRAYLSLLYETAKEVKHDALLIGQSPNPYLADVQDMLRLGICGGLRDSVVPEVNFGAAMARIADPDWLIDTNGWPIPSLTAFREYIEAQPAIGVPDLCYASHLDTTGEALTVEDYRRIRRVWKRG